MQFTEIFKRNWKFLTRNRKNVTGVIFNSSFIALLVLSVFWKVGEWPEAKLEQQIEDYLATHPVPDINELRAIVSTTVGEYIQNLAGLSFLMSN